MRRPYGPGKSTNESMVDELNSTTLSEDSKVLSKDRSQLRRPHAPSPAVSKSITTRVSGDECASNASVTSYESNTSRRTANIEEIRRIFTETSISSAEKQYADERSDDTEISQRLTNLSFIEKDIRQEKAALLAQMSKVVPKLIDPDLVKQQQDKKKDKTRGQLNGTRREEVPRSKCAAFTNLPLYKKNNACSSSKNPQAALMNALTQKLRVQDSNGQDDGSDEANSINEYAH